MKIKSVIVNNKKKSLEIFVGKKSYSFPFSKLRLKPAAKNPIKKIEVDRELASQAVTYHLGDGSEDTVHMDEFLWYNRDPKYVRDLLLYQLTSDAQDIIQEAGLSKNEIIRRLGTSPSQLYRLLDTTNYRKSIDEMLRLLAVLGCEVKLQVKRKVA